MNPTDRRLDILGVRPGVSKEELKTAYRALIRTSHPDRFQHDDALRKKAEERTKVLNDAYQYLLSNFELIPKSADPPENPTAKVRVDEEKKRQDAEYRRRKAQWAARESQYARQRCEKDKRDRQTLVLGVVFLALLFLYGAYQRRQANERLRAQMPMESVEGEPE